MSSYTRRRFVQLASGYASALVCGYLHVSDGLASSKLAVPPYLVISGGPRDRGVAYGKQFEGRIKAFLNDEIYEELAQRPAPKDEMLRYAAACGSEIAKYSPVIHDELQGIAEGARLPLDEVVLVTLHEELQHKGVLPKNEHCTAVAVGPPDTATGHTYVGQTWDDLKSDPGNSSVLCWQRTEGPSVLAYSYPGRWISAGVNSAGIGLTWVTVPPFADAVPAIGVPTYVMVAHALYQPTIEAVVEEFRRIPRAGWFSFMVADGSGNLASIEGTPRELAIETGRGYRVRDNSYGTRQMNRKLAGESVPCSGRCLSASYQLAEGLGKIDDAYIRRMFEDPDRGISREATVDMMVFDTSAREAYVSRGPSYGVEWQHFTFSGKEHR